MTAKNRYERRNKVAHLALRVGRQAVVKPRVSAAGPFKNARSSGGVKSLWGGFRLLRAQGEESKITKVAHDRAEEYHEENQIQYGEDQADEDEHFLNKEVPALAFETLLQRGKIAGRGVV